MLKAIVEILNEFMNSNVGVIVILDADWIFPQAPLEFAKLRMLQYRLIMDFWPHLAPIAANHIPVKLVTLDFVDHAS
ncbi:hypothetical protein ACSHT0_16230 [Tepidicaulis sp. LMO-SS28]|uniref:hypothetical protein n=1 Tax=Tepidicaulis sp. LMO-SS28 TaxID=3447455 RepID=UPI003EDF4050